ncbi:unnamed protein product [Brassica oleracea]|uniref:Ribonuclease n=2 Tax=Brassica TaxID=3705 RepID=A0A816JTM2_BRANA|nr:PREDICTED: staphylococcal nuclease domain-containing protein 1-like [Brassica oleracea var. oleracea]CAF1880639.1 unnamed protein product [Brassica napus]
MATATENQWLKGRVKAVTSGDCLVITALTHNRPGAPPEKTITLSSLMAPKMARRGGKDEPFAWESKEFLRKLCIGKEVAFKVDYKVEAIAGREFGSVFLGNQNLAKVVVQNGWAKVREQGQQSQGKVSPYIVELLQLQEQAKQEGFGCFSKVPGAAEASIRDLPPSAIGDAGGFDAMGLLAANKGKPMEGVVEQVRDGSTIRVYLLPEFQFVQVFVAGIQSPSMGRRNTNGNVVETVPAESNGDASGESRGPLTSAQRLAASAASSVEVSADPFAAEAKYFTEHRVLSRDVRVVLEGVDKFNNLIGSVHYSDGEAVKDLGLELVENGLAKYVEWSANMMEEEAKRKLKAAELQCKKDRVKMWASYVPPATNSKALHDQNFTGKVVEVVSGDCVVVADDAIPYGSPAAERRVNLSSIRCPKMGNPRREEKPAPYAREAREFLRQRLIGKQVIVQMEYSRKVTPGEGATTTADRIMDFGSVFIPSPSKGDTEEVTTASAISGTQPAGVNIAELLLSRGFGNVVRHRDFEERSNHYDALLAAESRALSGKKGIHSAKESPAMHITDLTVAAAKKAKDFLPSLQRIRRIPAVVEYVLSGHRCKLYIPKLTCSIAFAFSGVRCPGRGEPFSDEAISVMRRRIMQRDVEIEVETVDRTGTFLGSMWEGRTNVATVLLEAGLAKMQTSFGADRIVEAHILEQAERTAKNQKLKIWENYVEGQEVSNGSTTVETRQKETLKVAVTEVLGGGRFYVQSVGDQRISSIQNQLASLSVKDAPIIGSFNPKRGDIVLAQFSLDNSWNRAMIVSAPREAIQSPDEKLEVFYIDYGNQELVPYSAIRPIDPSVSSAPGLAQLCRLAYIKVPSLEEDFGPEAGEYLHTVTLGSGKEFKAVIEERDTSGGKVKGQGTGTELAVTLIAADEEISVNAAMLQEGIAKMEKRRRFEHKDKQAVLDALEKFQEEARKARTGIWQYGDVESDDEDTAPARKPAGGRR